MLNHYITYPNGTWTDLDRHITYYYLGSHYYGCSWFDLLIEYLPTIIIASAILSLIAIKLLSEIIPPKIEKALK
jgi:hypothetical protein